MRYFLCCLGFYLAILGVHSEQIPGKFMTFKHKKTDRKYLLHLPGGPSSGAPLVFVLHGYRGNAQDYMGELGLNQLADKHGFAVCYPQGAHDNEGISHWNARLKISVTDDIGFLSELAVHLQETHGLHAEKTFACGVSNGGFMSYALVAENPGIFRGAASVIGTMSGASWQARESIRPAPIMQISGMADEVVPYDGSLSPAGGWGGAPNQDEMIQFWTALNRTQTERVVQLSGRTRAHFYEGGMHGNEVWHIKIEGFGHRIPGHEELGVGVAALIWKFFSKI